MNADFSADSPVRPGARENGRCNSANRSVQQALYCDLWGEVTMFDLDKYLTDLIMSCRMSMISNRLFLSCLSGVKALLHASNILEEKDIPHRLHL